MPKQNKRKQRQQEEEQEEHAAAASPESEPTQDDDYASQALRGSQSKKIKSRAVYLTPAQEQDVADCYKNREWFYNFRCTKYKDTVRKTNALEEKAAQLGYTAHAGPSTARSYKLNHTK